LIKAKAAPKINLLFNKAALAEAGLLNTRVRLKQHNKV
jgi:hypothetical protein